MYIGAESTFEILPREISKSTSPLLVSQDIQSRKLQAIRNLFFVTLIADKLRRVLKSLWMLVFNNDYSFNKILILIKLIDKKLAIK